MEYKIVSIQRKNGEPLRDIHRHVLGCEVDVCSLEIGHSCYIKCFNEYVVRTSAVLAVDEVDGKTRIETLNTYYYLEELCQSEES